MDYRILSAHSILQGSLRKERLRNDSKTCLKPSNSSCKTCCNDKVIGDTFPQLCSSATRAFRPTNRTRRLRPPLSRRRDASVFSERRQPEAAGIVLSFNDCSTTSVKEISWSSGSWTACLAHCGTYSRSWNGFRKRKLGSAASQRQSIPQRQRVE